MDKLFNCQKYYIFKIRDLVNNSFHTLEEKRSECLLQYLDLCISTYDEYRLSLDPNKLKRSYECLIEGIAYQMKKHPFRKLPFYRSDFEYLRTLISSADEQREKELHNIHRNMVSLRKKIASANIIEDYILCLHQEDNFNGMDNLMECLISDLLYKGYSLSYLYEWFKKQQDEFMKNGRDVSIIDKLRELDREYEGHTIYICFTINSNTQLQPALQLLSKHFDIKKRIECPFIDDNCVKGIYVASKEYRALDVRKAIMLAETEFKAAKELFDMWQGTTRCIKDDIHYGWVENGEFYTENVKKNNTIKVLDYIDANYKKQMKRFLALKDDSGNEDIKALERILYTLNTAKTYTDQNRFLNFWSALEYALYPFPRFTIIEKARVVVPESFSLFYIKNKMNIFWARLSHYLKTRMEDETLKEIVLFYQECLEDDGDYNTKKFLGIFQDEQRVNRIAECILNHVVIYREWLEVSMLIMSPQKATKEIEDYFEGIKNDLNYIYRIRNQLIHSAKGVDDSLEYVSMRLYRYVNSILSTILYYKEKNNEYTIIDILSSIDATYKEYSKSWSEEKKRKKQVEDTEVRMSLENAYHLVRPPYLFME